MFYPTNLRSDFFSTLSEDKAEEFHLRISSHFSTFFIYIDEKYEVFIYNEKNENFIKNLKEALQQTIVLPAKTLLVATHNILTQQALQTKYKLFELTHKDKNIEVSALLNALTILTTPTSNHVDVEIIDVLQWEGNAIYTIFPYNKRMEVINEKLETQQGNIYVDDNKSIFLSVAKIISNSKQMQTAMAFEQLQETQDNIYVKIVLYGKEKYSFYSNYILLMEQKTGEILKDAYDVLIPREYAQLERLLIPGGG